MSLNVRAQIEIEGEALEGYSHLKLRQEFNAHHEFSVSFPFTAIESRASIEIQNAQQFVGKSIVIKFLQLPNDEELLLFRGVISEIKLEMADNFQRSLVLRGQSPTILLESGPDFNSYLDMPLRAVVDEVLAPVSNAGFMVDTSNSNYPNPTPYLCQYNESAFNFLNRLSQDYIQPFYYDGTKVVFGAVQTTEYQMAYGVDVDFYNISYKVVPLNFNKYVYYWADHRVVREDAPADLSRARLNAINQTIVQQSHALYSEGGQTYLHQAIDELDDIAQLVRIEKHLKATRIQTIYGSSTRPEVQLGTKMVLLTTNVETREEGTQGSYFITAVNHYVSENGVYYNTFEGVTSEVEFFPLNKAINPMPEVQMGVVMDNNDPRGKGRVKVQMHWQERKGVTTNWIKVLTPDAGTGRDNGPNRGFMAIPEVGDAVVVYFAHNNPNYPFVIGSLFTGQNAGGGGAGNATKSLSHVSGSNITLQGDMIIIEDAGGNKIEWDGVNIINITANDETNIVSDQKIKLTVGSSYIEITPDKITIKSAEVKIDAETADIQGSSKAVLKQTDSNAFKAEGNNAEMTGLKVEVKGTTEAKLDGVNTTVNGSAMTVVKGGMVNINS